MKLSKSLIAFIIFAILCFVQTRFRTRTKVNQAQNFVQFARISYCSPTKLLDPTCQVCRQIGFSGFSVEKSYTYDRSVNGRQIRINMTISKSLNGQQIIVSFGGPKTEDLIDIQSLYRSGFVQINQNQIEKGFWDLYEGAMRNDLINRLDDLNYTQLTFVGHSVGGSLAVLAAYDVSASNLGIPKPFVYVYGALTVGDQKFINHFKNLAQVVRIKKNQDLYVQFPYCLITDLNYSTCFDDYSTLITRYPFYRDYLRVAYPYYSSYGYWAHPFYEGYPYYSYGYGYGHPYGHLYGAYPNYPNSYYPRDDRDDRVLDQPHKLGNEKEKVNDHDPDQDETETIKSTTLNNKTKNIKDQPVFGLNNRDNIKRIRNNLKNLKEELAVQETKEEETSRDEQDSQLEEKEPEIQEEVEEVEVPQKNNKQNTRRNRVNQNLSQDGYATENGSRYSESSSNSPSGYSDLGGSGNSAQRKNITSSSYSSANFLEKNMKRSSRMNAARVLRKAFNGFFEALENCKITKGAANCELDPTVHKTYYGVDIENCY